MKHKNPIGVIFIAYNNKITASEQQNYFEEKINTNCKNDEQLFSEKTRDQYYPGLENIKPGTSFPNYGALCRDLGQATKAGNAKKAQMKQWQLFFKFRKENGSNRYTIEEIYESPMAKPLRKSNSPFRDIEVVLLWLLITDQMPEYITYSYLGYLIGLVNIDFCHTIHGENCPTIQNEVEKSASMAVSDCVYSCLRELLMRVLKRLEIEGIITVSRTKMVRVLETNDQGRNEETVRVATDEEIRLDDQINADVLKKIDCQNMQEVYRKNRFHAFKKAKRAYVNNCSTFLYLYEAMKITLENPIPIDSNRIQELRGYLNAQFLEKCLARKLRKKVNPYDEYYLYCFFILKDRIIKKSDFDYFFMLFCDKELPNSEMPCAIKQFKHEECLD